MKKKKSYMMTLGIIIVFIITITILLILYKQKMLEEEQLVKLLQKKGLDIEYRLPSMFYVYLELIYKQGLAILMFIPPLIVLSTGLYNIYKKVKTGFYKYIVNTRMTYQSFIKKEILHCYKYAFIVPILYLILLLGCGILTKFNLTLSLEGIDHSIYEIAFNSPVVLILVTFINLLLADIFYINIGLLTMKKAKNIFLNIIFSYLIILLFSIIFELFVGVVLAGVTGINVFANIFNFYNIWMPLDSDNILFVTIYLLIISSVSTFIVFASYKNEEKVVNNVS